MQVVESPNTYSPDPEARSPYLAGGITKCPDWQQEMIHLLAQTDLVIFNPRRRHFPMEDASAAEEQIRWAHRHLRLASDILLWFPCKTLCPIALYELGAWSMTDKPIYVGVHEVEVEEETKRLEALGAAIDKDALKKDKVVMEIQIEAAAKAL